MKNATSKWVFVLLSCVVVACSREQREKPAQSSKAVSTRPDTTWTTALTEKPAPADHGESIPVLVGVKTTVEQGFERITFDFNGGLPGYKIDYLHEPPTACGSGQMVDMPAYVWLSLRFSPANAHSEAGAPSVANRDELFTGRNLKRFKLICDFEAVVEWSASLDAKVPFRVTEQRSPDRLIVDLQNEH